MPARISDLPWRFGPRLSGFAQRLRPPCPDLCTSVDNRVSEHNPRTRSVRRFEWGLTSHEARETISDGNCRSVVGAQSATLSREGLEGRKAVMRRNRYNSTRLKSGEGKIRRGL